MKHVSALVNYTGLMQPALGFIYREEISTLFIPYVFL